MKTVESCDNFRSRGSMGAGEFDRPFVGLRAAVTEKNFPRETSLDDRLGESALGLHVPGVGYMNQLADLVPDRFDNLRRAVPQKVASPAGKKVEVPISLRIPNLRPFPPNQARWVPGVVADHLLIEKLDRLFRGEGGRRMFNVDSIG